jgi:hypothetical protein
MDTCTARRIALLGIALAVIGPALAAQDPEPIVGTWALNVAKSTFTPGPAPKSETRTYVMEGQSSKVSSTGVDGDGKPIAREWTVVFDGRDRPMTGDPDADLISSKRVDALTSEFVQKNAGRVVITGTHTILKDGSTLTITTKGINAQGQAISNVLVFEKR